MKTEKEEATIVAISATMKPDFSGRGPSFSSKFDQLPLRLDIAISSAIGLHAALHEFRSKLTDPRGGLPDPHVLALAMKALLQVGDQLYDIADFKYGLDDGRKATVKRPKKNARRQR